MRIVMISAGLSPRRYGGVPRYVRELIEGLRGRGHEVFYLDTLSPSSFGQPSIESTALMPQSFVFHNSGATPPFGHDGNLRGPRSETHARKASIRVLQEFLHTISPDILHFQELLGLPTNAVRELSGERWKLVLTAHDYFAVCPTIHLVDSDGNICHRKTEALTCDRCIHHWEHAVPRPFTGWLLSRVRAGKLPPSVGYRFSHRIARYLDPLIRSVTHSRRRYRRRRQTMESNLLFFDRILCVSQAHMENLQMRVGNLRSLRLLYPSRKSVVQSPTPELRPHDGVIRFVALNVTQRIKGLDLLLREFARVRQHRRNAELHVYGAPELQQEGVYRHLSFAESDFARILGAVDVGVIPSVWPEAYGIVGPEMLSHGVPVIGSDIGAIPEYIQHERNGLLFDPTVPGALASAMIRLIDAPGLLMQLRSFAAMSHAGMVRFDAHLTALIDEYTSLMSGTTET